MYHGKLHHANQTSRYQLRPDMDHADEQLESGSSFFSSMEDKSTSLLESNDTQGVPRLDRLPTECIAMITQELMLSSTFQTRDDFIPFSVSCKRVYYIVKGQKKAVFRDWMRMHYTDDQIERIARLLESSDPYFARIKLQAIQDGGICWVDDILTEESWPELWGILTLMPSLRDVIAAHGMERQGKFFQFEDHNQQHEEACVGNLKAPSDVTSDLGKWARAGENPGIIFGSRSQLQTVPGVSEVRSLLDIAIFHAHSSWVVNYEAPLRNRFTARSRGVPWPLARNNDSGWIYETMLWKQHVKVMDITRYAVLRSLERRTTTASFEERFNQSVERILVEEEFCPTRPQGTTTRTESAVDLRLEWEMFNVQYLRDPVASGILISEPLFVHKFLSCKNGDRLTFIQSANHVIVDNYLEYNRERIVSRGRLARVEYGTWTPV